MPDLTTSEIIFLVAVLLFTAVAAISDIRTRKIPNRITVPMCVAGLIFQISFHQLDGLWTALLGFATGFSILFVLWMIGSAGGGDVKLMGALGPWLGAVATLKVIFVSVLFVMAGTVGLVLWGILSIGIRRTMAKYLKGTTEPETTQKRQKRRVMAFAAPVALATWCVLAMQFFGPNGS